jgi:hypothetical protein
MTNYQIAGSICGPENDRFHPRMVVGLALTDGGNGASVRVPAAKAQRPLSVQSTNLRGDAGQRARRAVRSSW